MKIIQALVGIDAGTRKRTITAAITAVLDFLSVFNIVHFTDPQVQAIQKLVLVIVTGFVWAYCSHYRNNDFTEEAAQGTGMTRLLKAQKKDNSIFFTEPEELEEDKWEE